MSYPTPAFRITIEERDITRIVSQRLISMTLTECRGDEADQLDISLDDSDGKLALPPKGARIGIQIGWKDGDLADKGLFTVDEVEHAGAPDTITLRARSANLIDTFKQQRERSFHDTTLGAIIDAVAFQNELASGISARLRNTAVKHIDQTHESDAAFLRRLGKKYDAVATVKNDTLLFIPINQSRTASGKELPLIAIVRVLGDAHRYHSSESNAYSGVRAFWHDERYRHRRSVVAGVPGNSKRLRTTFASETDARTAATAEWQRIKRGLATFEMTLALGNPFVMPQSPVIVKGYKPEIDATEWLSVKVTHSISGSGFTTRVEFETKPSRQMPSVKTRKTRTKALPASSPNGATPSPRKPANNWPAPAPMPRRSSIFTSASKGRSVRRNWSGKKLKKYAKSSRKTATDHQRHSMVHPDHD